MNWTDINSFLTGKIEELKAVSNNLEDGDFCLLQLGGNREDTIVMQKIVLARIGGSCLQLLDFQRLAPTCIDGLRSNATLYKL